MGDESNWAVIISTYNRELVKLKFTSGVNFSDQGDWVVVKINSAELPSEMKNFKKIMVSAINENSPKMISFAIEETIKHKNYCDYDTKNGFVELADGPYYVVTLFDDIGNFLGYSVVER